VYYNPGVVKLSPRQIQALASCICGGGEAAAFEYRTAADIDRFMKFSGARLPTSLSGSRFRVALQFLEHANSDSNKGPSGLSLDMEQIIVALLDHREFASDANHDEAVAITVEILKGTPVKVVVAADRSVSLQSARVTRGQRVMDQQIHTVFGTTLAESELHAAREHYSKAKRHLDSSTPDYPNSCKESVCMLEALATALTGEADLPKALRRAVAEGLITKPLDEVVIKLYAYRGNEPGVGHGQAEVPRVGREEAELLLNLAGSLGKFLNEKLRT
jgi:hypothetical protein